MTSEDKLNLHELFNAVVDFPEMQEALLDSLNEEDLSGYIASLQLPRRTRQLVGAQPLVEADKVLRLPESLPAAPEMPSRSLEWRRRLASLNNLTPKHGLLLGAGLAVVTGLSFYLKVRSGPGHNGEIVPEVA